VFRFRVSPVPDDLFFIVASRVEATFRTVAGGQISYDLSAWVDRNDQVLRRPRGGLAPTPLFRVPILSSTAVWIGSIV